jgi:hypothetical protein
MGFFFPDDKEWAAEMLSRLAASESVELPSVYARTERRSRFAEDELLPRRKRARVRLNGDDAVIPMPANKKRRRMRLENATIIQFGPTFEQRVRTAFAKVGGIQFFE